MTRRHLPFAALAAALATSVLAQPQARASAGDVRGPVAVPVLEFPLPVQITQVTDAARDGAGNLVVAGVTYAAGFPTTPDAADRTCGTNGDAFVMIYSPSGRLRYSTCLGGDTSEVWAHVAAAPDGSLWVATTTSLWVEPDSGCFHCQDTRVAVWRIMPGLPGFWQQGWLNPPGTLARASEVAAAPDGSVWVMATTQSPGIPVLNAWQPTFGGASDILLARYASGRPELLLLTYLGGSGWDSGGSLAIAPDGDAVLTGLATTADFPLVLPELRESLGAVLARVDLSGRWLEYSTFLGRCGYEVARVAVDARGRTIVIAKSGAGPDPRVPSSPVRYWYRDLYLGVVDDVGRMCSCGLVDTGLERIAATDTNARVLSLAARGDGSIIVVGSYYTDDLISGSYFVTVTDAAGTARGEPLVVTKPKQDVSFVEAAVSSGRDVYIVAYDVTPPPWQRKVITLKLRATTSDGNDPRGGHDRR